MSAVPVHPGGGTQDEAPRGLQTAEAAVERAEHGLAVLAFYTAPGASIASPDAYVRLLTAEFDRLSRISEDSTELYSGYAEMQRLLKETQRE